jgi:N6-adenosine-specific RNA methylase IME4
MRDQKSSNREAELPAPPRIGFGDWLDGTVKYKTIVADPPWHYDEFAQNCTTNRVVKPLPYQSMTLEEIRNLPVKEIADTDCRLFLWTTNRYLPDAFGVMAAWGFDYKQTIVWHKVGNPSPWGGSVAPNHAEYLLVGVRGKPERKGMMKSNVVGVNVQRHSAKPDVFMDLVETVSPAPYVELFCREARLGWDRWGNESASNVALVPSNIRS